MITQVPVSVVRARPASTEQAPAPVVNGQRAFADARPEAVTQSALQEMADNSLRVAGLTALAGALNSSPRMLQMRAQAHNINNGSRVAGQRMPRDAAIVAQQVQRRSTRAVVQRVDWEDVRNDPNIAIVMEGPYFVAYYQGERAGELELYEDGQGRQWLNNIEVNAGFQRRGIGLSLLNAAVLHHEEVYAATGMEAYEEENGDDTRHLSPEGVALVNSALRNGVLQPDWCFNPAEEHEVEMLEAEELGEEYGEEWGGLEEWGGEEFEEEEEEEEEGAREATCTAVVVLDDSNTGGIGYQFRVELTNVANGATRTVEFDDLIPGEESLTTVGLEGALSRALDADIELTSWEIDYAD